MLWVSIWMIFPAGASAPTEPFWRAKPKVYEQVVQNHRIFVSVTSDHQAGQKRMKVSGGGRVKAPRDFVQKQSLNFEGFLPKIGYIESFQVDRKHRFLFIKVSAYGFKAAQKISWEEHVGAVDFKITSGALAGFTGRVSMEDKGPFSTDVGIEGSYDYQEFPLPALFLSFGLEVIFHRLSVELRSFIEESFKHENTTGNPPLPKSSFP